MSKKEQILRTGFNMTLQQAQKSKGKFDATVDVVKDTYKDVKKLVTDPIGVLKETKDSLKNVAAHPIVTAKTIAGSVKDSFEKDVLHGNAYSRSYWGTKATIHTVTAVVGTKGAGSLTKVGKLPDTPDYKATTSSKQTVKEDSPSKSVEPTKGTGELKHPVLDNPRVGSALKDDFYHNFNDIIDNYAVDAQRFDLPNKKGHMDSLYQIEGSMVKYETKYVEVKNNAPEMLQTKETRDGVFEWVVDPTTNTVTHRTFIPGGKVSGKINQWGK